MTNPEIRVGGVTLTCSTAIFEARKEGIVITESELDAILGQRGK